MKHSRAFFVLGVISLVVAVFVYVTALAFPEFVPQDAQKQFATMFKHNWIPFLIGLVFLVVAFVLYTLKYQHDNRTR